MKQTISEPTLQRLSEFIAARMGLNFPPERFADLERLLGRAACDFGLPSARACAEWLINSPVSRRQIEKLAGHLTVGETYFFRDDRSFELLESQILPELIARRFAGEKRLRLWSAGCSSGEEAYSIAITVSRLLPDLADWIVTILATDLNPAALQKAEAGVYGRWSFRGVSREMLETYFRPRENGRFEVAPQIKRMVSFRLLNLAEDLYPSLVSNTNAMDVIFCRNVLMYFTPEQMRQAIAKLQRSLVEGGWLVVSPSELSHMLFSQFLTVNFVGATLYRKAEIAARQAMDWPPALLSAADEAPCEAETPAPEVSFGVNEPVPIPDLPAPEPLPEVKSDRYDEALALYQQGQYEAAVDRALMLRAGHMGNSSAEAPATEDAGAAALLARACANLGRLDEAEAWCERAIRADRFNPAKYYLRATVAQERGLIEDARQALRQALYLDPDFALAHFAAGNLARQAGRTEEAERAWATALSLLERYGRDELLPEGEGLTAGRLIEIIRASGRRA